MSFCRHKWRDRSTLLKNVFPQSDERIRCRFLVCEKCMMIKEIKLEREQPEVIMTFPYCQGEESKKERSDVAPGDRIGVSTGHSEGENPKIGPGDDR